jgi:hypothetical protein
LKFVVRKEERSMRCPKCYSPRLEQQHTNYLVHPPIHKLRSISCPKCGWHATEYPPMTFREYLEVSLQFGSDAAADRWRLVYHKKLDHPELQALLLKVDEAKQGLTEYITKLPTLIWDTPGTVRLPKQEEYKSGCIDEPRTGLYAAAICDLCIDGKGEACNTPACIFCRHRVPENGLMRELLTPLTPLRQDNPGPNRYIEAVPPEGRHQFECVYCGAPIVPGVHPNCCAETRDKKGPLGEEVPR